MIHKNVLFVANNGKVLRFSDYGPNEEEIFIAIEDNEKTEGVIGVRKTQIEELLRALSMIEPNEILSHD